MKKLLIALNFIICFLSATFAQKIQGGLKGLSNINWIKSNESTFTNDGLRLGLGWGVFADYKLTKNYFLSASLDFLYSGINIQAQNSAYTQHIKYDLNYVSLPITIKMKTNEIGHMKYFGQFGIDPGVNLKARADIETITSQSTVIVENQNVKSDIFPLRLALVVGLGTEYNIVGSTSLVGSITFNNGFVSVLKNNSSTTINEQANAHFVALNVGIIF